MKCVTVSVFNNTITVCHEHCALFQVLILFQKSSSYFRVFWLSLKYMCVVYCLYNVKPMSVLYFSFLRLIFVFILDIFKIVSLTPVFFLLVLNLKCGPLKETIVGQQLMVVFILKYSDIIAVAKSC